MLQSFVSVVFHQIMSAAFGTSPKQRCSPKGFAGKTQRKLLFLTVFSIIGGIGACANRSSPDSVRPVVRPPELTPHEPSARPSTGLITFVEQSGKAKSVAPMTEFGKPVSKGIQLEPDFPGEWSWDGTGTQLKFVPKQEWPAGETFTVRFKSFLFAPHIKVDTDKISFETPRFSGELKNLVFQQDKKMPKNFQVLATLETTHAVDPTSVKDRISMELVEGTTSKPMAVTLRYDSQQRRIYIASLPFELPAQQAFMKVIVNEGIVPQKGLGRLGNLFQQIAIKSLQDFIDIRQFSSTLVRNEQDEPEQLLSVHWTTEMPSKEVAEKLHAYLLPVPPKRSARTAGNVKIPRRFNGPGEVNEDILKKAEAVSLTPIPTEHDAEEILFFRFHAPARRQLYVKVDKGVRSREGFVLGRSRDNVVNIPVFPKEVHIQQPGALLPLSGEKKLSLMTRGVPAVKVEVARVLEGRLQYVVTQSYGEFQKPSFERSSFGEDDFTEKFGEVLKFSEKDPAKPVYTTVDVSKYLHNPGSGQKGIFLFRVVAWNPKNNKPLAESSAEESQEEDLEKEKRAAGDEGEEEAFSEPGEESTSLQDSQNLFEQRLLLVTNLAPLAKENYDHSRDLFVMSVPSGGPVGGAEVSVLGKNGLPVFQGTTSSDGHLAIPPLHKLQRERKPVLYLIRHGEDVTFLPYDRDDRRVNLSRFAIEGEYAKESPTTLRAFVFSDRGIYRPGESVHLGVLVKPEDWTRPVANVPLQVVVTDSGEREIKRQRVVVPANGLMDIPVYTQAEFPTGEYKAEVLLVKQEENTESIGSTTFEVREFVPDRMKIETRLTEGLEKGWVSPERVKAQVTLQQLFGDPAEKRRVEGELTVQRSRFSFDEYPEHRFADPFEAINAKLQDKVDLPVQQTDSQGHAIFPLPLKGYDKTSYRLTFLARGFETAEGGRSVTGLSSVLVSPFPYLLGVKPDGNLDFVTKKSKRSVEVIAVNPKLKQVGINGVRARWIEQKYESVLVKQENDSWKYESKLKQVRVQEQTVSVSDKGTQIPLWTDRPGSYVLVLLGEQQGELLEMAKVSYGVTGAGQIDASRQRDAEVKVTLNKPEYRAEEEIQLGITAPYSGAGLITIECEKVYAYKWFHSDTTSSTQTIRVPKNLEGNGYVHVSFVRDLKSREIFMSPLSTGVVPFRINQERRTVKVQAEVPTQVKPGEDLVLQLKADRPAKAIVFAVDEGILQVAGYKTPHPLSFFFQKRALQVQTLQILDLIMPEFSVYREASQVGGGEDEEMKALARNLNPFRRKKDLPVAFWSGLIDVGPKETSVKYRIPEGFAGALRVMAVVAAPDAVGHFEKRVSAKGDFVLSPNVPLMASPGDQFDVSVGVFNNIEGSGKDLDVKVTVQPKEGVVVVGTNEQHVSVSEAREGLVHFTIRATAQLGSAELLFTASGKGKQTKAKASLSVRPATPHRVALKNGRLPSGKIEVLLEEPLYAAHQKGTVALSVVPSSLLPGLVQYLEAFPHGCTEQLVSKAFAVLPLGPWGPAVGVKPDEVQTHLRRTVGVLRARQDDRGAFGYWSSQDTKAISFVSAYATHFLTEAKENGYEVSADLLRRSLLFLQEMAMQEPKDLMEARAQAYAIYVLTRNAKVTTTAIQHLLGYLNRAHSGAWRTDLTGVYLAGAYKLMREDVKAGDLIMTYALLGKREQTAYWEDFYSPLGADAQFFSMVMKHFPERWSMMKPNDIENLVAPLLTGAYNTLSVAYAAQALVQYAKLVNARETPVFQATATLADGSTVPLTSDGNPFWRATLPIGTQKLTLVSSGPGYYQVQQSGFAQNTPTQAHQSQIEVLRDLFAGKVPVQGAVSLGQELTVQLHIRGIGKRAWDHVAVVDLLPGGFEVVPESIEAGMGKQGMDFVDVREDRVIFYGTFTEQPSNLTYRIRAINTGTFRVPPAYCQAMYRPQVEAWSASGSLEVKPNKS